MMGVPGGEDLPDQLLGKVEGLLAVVRQVRPWETQRLEPGWSLEGLVSQRSWLPVGQARR